MAHDKELTGVEFDYVTELGTFHCFVAQADPDIGITAKPFEPEAMEKAGFHYDENDEMNAICLSKSVNFNDTGTFSKEYEFCKKDP